MKLAVDTIEAHFIALKFTTSYKKELEKSSKKPKETIYF